MSAAIQKLAVFRRHAKDVQMDAKKGLGEIITEAVPIVISPSTLAAQETSQKGG